jgi:hypothetical protein
MRLSKSMFAGSLLALSSTAFADTIQCPSATTLVNVFSTVSGSACKINIPTKQEAWVSVDSYSCSYLSKTPNPENIGVVLSQVGKDIKNCSSTEVNLKGLVCHYTLSNPLKVVDKKTETKAFSVSIPFPKDQSGKNYTCKVSSGCSFTCTPPSTTPKRK